MNERDLAWVAKATGAKSARQTERIQSLWSGYGEIVRVELAGAGVDTVVVKSVKPPPRPEDERSHARKCRSYAVETNFYRSYASRCDDECRVPRLVESRATKEDWLFVLEDIDAAGFPERRRSPRGPELSACLRWLAAFHARFLGVAPEGLWKNGTYWHLDTRPDELAAVEDPEVRAAAPVLDRKLRECSFQTLVHGDAKPANFCFARGAGASVAAVDFQYVGGGCGMKDVAYLLSGEANEDRALDEYFVHLRRAGAPPAVEAEWRRLYPVARADYHRFLAGWAR